MNHKVILATISIDNVAGGLERNLARIANALSARGYDVHLVTFDLQGAQSFYPLDPKITWHQTGTRTPHTPVTFMERWALIKRLRAAIRPKTGQKTTLIVFHHGILFRFMMAGLLLPIRIICSERNALSLYEHIGQKKWNLNFCLLYCVTKIIVQFECYRQDYPAPLRGRIQAIPNMVITPEHLARPQHSSEEGRFTLLAVGRLCAQKNFDLLIEAFANLAEKNPKWDLLILGDGGLREALQTQIDRAKLQTRIKIVKPHLNVMQEYARAHIFCMPSKWEGFPNALAEALAAGLPAIGYAECSGVNDLIKSEENGLLAKGRNNLGSLTKTLSDLMQDPEKRRIMGQAARQSVAAYAPENVLPQWFGLLEE